MEGNTTPKITKWPFFAGDLMLVGFAVAVFYYCPQPMPVWQVIISGVAIFFGAWFGISPFLHQYRTSVKIAEADSLAETVEQIQKMEVVGQQISNATMSWSAAQEMAEKTAQTAKGLADKMIAETQAFENFLKNANETEKNHLRLEIEKMHRAQEEWLQVVVGLLDHVYALHQAGLKSGQPGLIEQLSKFQAACRDIARHMGLVAFAPKPDDLYDSKTVQTPQDDEKVPQNALIDQVLMPGFTFQGRIVRRAMVTFKLPISIPAPVSQNAVSQVTTPETPIETASVTISPPSPDKTTDTSSVSLSSSPRPEPGLM